MVSRHFSALLLRIQPTEAERARAAQHIAVIKVRLKTVFDISTTRITGSAARGTSIRGGSDTDLFAVFRKVNFTRGGGLIGSDTVLDHVRRQLLMRYPSSDVGRDIMAVTVRFSDGHQVDVVPALFDSFRETHPVYLMPDGMGGWMQTAPSLHDQYIQKANSISGGKLRYVAQMMKYWRACRSPQIPISSFHLEMLLAQEGTCRGVKSYAACLRDTFRVLAARSCRDLQDPLGISGYIPAARTDNQREIASASIASSRNHVNSAVELEAVDSGESIRQWNLVFNYRFRS